MDKELKEVLFQSLNMTAPSGSEEQVTSLFCDFVSTYVDEVSTDANGNCIAHKRGSGQKIMFMAHADEIGLMVSYIDDRGFLYFKEIGGIDTKMLPTQRVSIIGKNGLIKGVIGCKPIHLQDKSDNNKELSPEDLWIDIAASCKEDAQAKVQIGAVATFESNATNLSDTLILSKSLDDRIGLAVLMGLAQNLPHIATDADIYFVASIQEELGARGAKMITESIRPDIGIAIDVTHATDYPSMSPAKDGDISLGKGPVIPFGPNMTKGINQLLASIADSKAIPYQIEAIAKTTGTDAREIQVAASGIKTGLISIPCRYMHTPSEVVSLADTDNAISLLLEYLQFSKHNV